MIGASCAFYRECRWQARIDFDQRRNTPANDRFGPVNDTGVFGEKGKTDGARKCVDGATRGARPGGVMMSGALWATEEQTETLTKREKRVDGAPVRVCPVGVMKTGAQYGQLKNKLAETRKFETG